MVTEQVARLEAKLRDCALNGPPWLLHYKASQWNFESWHPATDPATPEGAWEWVNLLENYMPEINCHGPSKYAVTLFLDEPDKATGRYAIDTEAYADPIAAVAAAVAALAADADREGGQ